MTDEEPPFGFDPYSPKLARMGDFWREGHNNYEADRRKAREVDLHYHGAVRQVVADAAGFGVRAVTWAARQGISQYLDLGSGMLTGDCTHRTARAVIPAARVAYVDHDPEVIDETEVILDKDGHEGIAAVRADLRDPGAVLAAPGLLGVIDPGAPACVILALVLQFVPAEQAREAVAGYAARLAAGSVVVISVPRNDDPESFAEGRAVWDGELHNHSRQEVTGFFGDLLELVPPGLVVARGWRGGMPDADVSPGLPVYVLGGGAWKPLGRWMTSPSTNRVTCCAVTLLSVRSAPSFARIACEASALAISRACAAAVRSSGVASAIRVDSSAVKSWPSARLDGCIGSRLLISSSTCGRTVIVPSLLAGLISGVHKPPPPRILWRFGGVATAGGCCHWSP
jgi:O-methyltransferase involved in polyketide biosynthesis